VWKELVTRSEAEGTVLHKHFDVKVLFTVMLRLYAAIHRKMGDASETTQKNK
jgi:hypothetical protein